MYVTATTTTTTTTTPTTSTVTTSHTSSETTPGPGEYMYMIKLTEIVHFSLDTHTHTPTLHKHIVYSAGTVLRDKNLDYSYSRFKDMKDDPKSRSDLRWLRSFKIIGTVTCSCKSRISRLTTRCVLFQTTQTKKNHQPSCQSSSALLSSSSSLQ